MKQFITVLKFELGNYFKNKSFVVTTVILAIVLAAVVAVPTLFQSDSSDQKTEDNQVESTQTYAIADLNQSFQDISIITDKMPAKWMIEDSAESVNKAVESGEAEAGFILNSATDFTYVVQNSGMSDTKDMQFSSILEMVFKETYLQNKGLTPEEIMVLDQTVVTNDIEILGKDSISNYGYTYVLVFVLYFLILFYGQMIATSVTTEKSNRAIEILVTSVSSNSLIFGKVIAGAIAGVVQVIVILGSAFASYSAFSEAWGNRLDFLFNIPAEVFLAFAVFGLLGYLLYAFIYGTLGALVSKTEDISKSATFITLIYVVSFMVAIFGMMDSDGMMIRIASFIPFTSSNAMLIRVSMGSVQLWEILVSLVLLLASCGVVGMLAAKLFRFGTLMYGNPIKITKALKSLKNQK